MRPEKRPTTLRCQWCKKKIAVKSRGRLPAYCSHSCRQRAHERAKWQQPHEDLGSVALQTKITQTVRDLTEELLRRALGGRAKPAAPKKGSPSIARCPRRRRLVRPGIGVHIITGRQRSKKQQGARPVPPSVYFSLISTAPSNSSEKLNTD